MEDSVRPPGPGPSEGLAFCSRLGLEVVGAEARLAWEMKSGAHSRLCLRTLL